MYDRCERLMTWVFIRGTLHHDKDSLSKVGPGFFPSHLPQDIHAMYVGIPPSCIFM